MTVGLPSGGYRLGLYVVQLIAMKKVELRVEYPTSQVHIQIPASQLSFSYPFQLVA